MGKKKSTQKAIDNEAAVREVFMPRLRQARRDAQLTQMDVAKRIGASPGAVSRWFSGNALPESAYIPALARELRVTTDWLFGLDDREPCEAIKEHFCLMKLQEAVEGFVKDIEFINGIEEDKEEE